MFGFQFYVISSKTNSLFINVFVLSMYSTLTEINYLNLIKELIEYNNIYKTVAEVAIKS